MNRALKTAIVPLAFALVSGCAMSPMARQQVYYPAAPVQHDVPKPDDGAIYQAESEVRLFEDIKARRVGDVITIILQESTAASKSASTATDKATSVNIDSPTILGAIPTFNTSHLLPLDNNHNNTLENILNSSNTFAGKGDASQSNSLNGSITVTVAEVLSNGNLVVRGEKWLTLNQGQEFVRISGIVRPQDISTANTVFSTQVADARIAYSGEGMIASANHPGWLARFFNSAWWPF